MVRRLVALALALGLASASTPAAAQAPLGPGPSGGFYTFTAGSDLEGTEPVADIAGGFDVWIDPSAPHAARIGPAVKYAVGQLDRYGISIRYKGIAARGKLPTGSGIVTITEATGAAEQTCTRRPSADRGAITEAVTYPNFQDVGIATRIDAATVTFCAPLWSHGEDYVTAIALHELGHAVGLGHFPGMYRGRTQLMNPIVPDLLTYQAGDVNGLRYIAAQTVALQQRSVVAGAVESWSVKRGGLAVTGWAVVGTTSEFADISVTRDGTAVYRITTNTPRPDIVQRYHTRWPNPGFSGSQAPMLTGTHRYCVIASAASSAAVTLGCRSLVYPPPEPTTAPRPLPALGKAPVQVWESSPAAWIGIGAAGVLVLLVAGFAFWRRRT